MPPALHSSADGGVCVEFLEIENKISFNYVTFLNEKEKFNKNNKDTKNQQQQQTLYIIYEN